MNESTNETSILHRPAVRALLDEGVQLGRVSYNHILEALGDDAIEDEAVEEVLEALETRRIALVEDDELLIPASTPSPPTSSKPAQTPSSTSPASPSSKTAAPSTLDASSPAAPVKKAAHADLDEVLAAIDRMNALPTAPDQIASISDSLSDETDDEEGPAVQDAFRQYLDRMAEIPLLSEAEEFELAQKVRSQSWDADEARQKLVESNLRLVVFMARKYEERTTLPLLDIVQEGTIGLLRAIDRFDPARNHRLGTYATWWIRQSINRAVADQGRSMKLPAQLADAIQKLQKLQRELSQKLGRSPSREELAEASGLSTIAVAEALRAALQPLSLEGPVGGDASFELGEGIVGGEDDAPMANLARLELKRELDASLVFLSEIERTVIEKRYGMGEFSEAGERALGDVASEMHLSPERVRQLEIRALRKLRRRSEHLRDDDEDID